MTQLTDRLKGTFCVWFGHSRISTMCLGYVYCARCGEQTGDTLMLSPVPDSVIVGHNCDTCRDNYTRCTWRDKIFAPDPFEEKTK